MNTPTTFWGPFTQPPNLLILMTDQQRTTQHMPRDWVKNNLPNLYALQQTGVTFPNAMTNATACSPSRATLWTSTYPTVNGVTYVGATLQLPQNVATGPSPTTYPLATLSQVLATLASSGINYQIAYKGKWHLTGDFASGLSSEEQLGAVSQLASDDATMASVYGFPGWTSPDFGTFMDTSSNPVNLIPPIINSLGGGFGANDARITNGVSFSEMNSEVVIVENAVQFLQNYTPNGQGTNPFCLIVSLLNPHDIFVSPFLYEQAGYWDAFRGDKQPWRVAPFTEIQLPHNYNVSSEQKATKPAAQWAWQAAAFGSDLNEEQALDYLRFYAYLETLTDAMLGEVMSAMNADLTDNTLVVRLSDHGEMAMSQGGMREKEENAYKETLLVPMIFSNPGLPQGASCRGLAGLIDIMPTLAEICGVTDLSTYAVQGQSLASAILSGDSGETYNQFLFATDDASVPIRCVVEDQQYNAKYAVYYEITPADGNANGYSYNWQCELYPFSSDPATRTSEIINHIPVLGLQTGQQASTSSAQRTWSAMHTLLTDLMTQTNTLPENWPAAPPPPPPDNE